MDYSLKYQIENPKPEKNRWGMDSREDDLTLLVKKDQQIKRLQAELET